MAASLSTTVSHPAVSIDMKPTTTKPPTAARADIARAVDAVLPRLRAIRHDLHQHPELCFEEKYTSAVVQRELAACGARVKAGMAKGTGVIGYLPATDPANESRGAIALRADMDALPILERTGRAYASTTEGLMHACGHDGHTAMLIGAAQVLSKVERPRPVLFVFQPAEEGGGGGDLMCKEGALAGEGRGGLGAPAKMIFGLHGWPTVEVGRVASRVGPLLAATDDFEVTVKGTQSHGAYPHFGNDPIVASAQMITALQTIASRNVSPLDSCVVTVGIIKAGTADNIIPETCTFVGTIRTLLPETRKLARERFYAIVEATAHAMGCGVHIDWRPGYPVTANDRGATELFFDVAKSCVGADLVEVVEQPTMGGEDFSYYGQHVPACFFLLGLRPRGAASFPTLHQPDFDFNDDALPVGVRVFCELATSTR
ncbi:MAG TPA: amidohydrolase [Phycisphaerales bacterium]|nr:amidohydrolase [Phycisphaerales bacterium]